MDGVPSYDEGVPRAWWYAAVKIRAHLDRDIREARILVKLSRSNLLSLLAGLDRKSVKRTVITASVTSPWTGTCVLMSEEDSQHYENGMEPESDIEIDQSNKFNEEDNPCGS